ncbi:YgfZ/GcvT domain-containing protein [Hyphobacterium sp.]|uniref:CAF17-like 4Fe-4S cluster assembly/insertion protein YgfZ n=1 Tax=Hyphobacterium sp. TaxID=2004662 RepID=UPI003BAC4690
MSSHVRHLADRSVIRIAGPDTSEFLQRVITTDIPAISPGEIKSGALLTPQGKVIADFLMHGTKDGIDLDIWREAAESLVKRLTLYRLRAKAEIVLDSNLAVIVGEGAADPRSPSLPHRSIQPASSGFEPGDSEQTAAEIRSGVPALGRDYFETEVFPTDVNLDLYGGIAWRKGCFIGQEVLSRMKRRGTIRKRTVKIEAKNTLLKQGDILLAGDRPLGTVTSAYDTTALAIVRLDRLEVAEVQPSIGGIAVNIIQPELD